MAAAGRAVRLASAEFKAATAGMDDWGASADGLQAKLSSLDKILEAQKKQLALREQELEKTIAAEGENSAAADRVRTALYNQQAQIARTEKEIKQYADQLEAVNRENDAAAEGTEKYKSATEQLTDTIADQERQLEKLKEAYKNAKLEGNEEDAQQYARAIKDLSGELAENKKKLSDADKAADDLDKTMVDVEGDTKKASDGFTTMKGVLANLVAEGIKKAISGLKDLGREAVEAYKEFDEGEDTIIKKTGATGEAAEALGENYKNVTKQVLGSFSDLGSGLGEINTRFGFTGEKLEDATVKFQKFSDITGTDLTESVRLVSRAMEDGGMETEEYGDLLDLLAKAAQASGVEVDSLAENVAKYGAPMRALGFDTKESIALFAQWEKTGVNTEIAFSGMKKAISNWSKEGKDARQEFAKSLKQIEETPDIAEATTKAIEIFGAKAGPDLADAIKGGRFAYEDFLALLEDSQGTVEETYEETLDGYDKVQLAIQNARSELGSFTGDLVKKYQPQIEDAIEKGVKAFKDGVNFVIQNKNTILSVIQAIATAFVTYNVVSTVTGVFGAFQNLFGLMQTGTGIVTALNTALGLNPYALIAAGIVAAGIALADYVSDQKAATAAQYQLTDAQKEVVNSSAELKKGYDQLAESRDQGISGTSAEFDYLRQLKDEYNGLVDSNGKVKEGYEDRADFIITRLAEAMGVEREEIEKNIDKNGQLGKSIDDLIQKKQAEAILDATKDEYTEAVKKRQEALNNYAQAQQVYDQAQQNYNQTVADASEKFEQYNQLIANSAGDPSQYYYQQSQLNQAIQESKNALDQAKQGVENAESSYVGYGATIQNWESLSQAAASGSSDAIASALTNIQNNFVTAETGTETSLQNQLTAFQQNYQNMKLAVEQGMPGVTEAQVKEAAELVDAADKELAKLQGKAKSDAQKASTGFANELGAGGAKAQKSAQKTAAAANKGYTSESKKANKAGQTSTENYAKGMKSSKGKASKAGDNVAKASVDSAKSTGKGMNAAGQYTGLQYGAGVSTKQSDARSKGKALANSAKSGAGSVSAESSGKNFGQGFINGIGAFLHSALEKGKELARKAVEGVKKGQQEGSPSKLTRRSGQFFTQGYILGIASQEKTLVKTVQALVGSAVNTLKTASGNEFEKAGQAAATQFTNGMQWRINYMMNRANYLNNSEIAKFDSQIAQLNAQSAAATAKLQAASNKKVAALQKKYNATSNKKTKANLKAQIDAEKAALKTRISTSEASYKKLINTQNEYKEAYQKASSEMLTELQTALDQYQQQAQALIDDTINGITGKYTEQYNALISKQDSLIEKMRSAGNLFDVSSAGIMTINDIKQQTADIKAYTEKLQKIKEKVSADLFDQITTYDMQEGSAFLDRLLAMSASDLSAYSAAYDEKMKAAQASAQNIYKTDLSKVSVNYKKEIDAAFKALPAQMAKLGNNAMKSFVDSLTSDTGYMSANIKTFVGAMVDEFKKDLGIHSPSKVTGQLGSYTGEGFVDGFADWIPEAVKAAGKLSEAAKTPIEQLRDAINQRIPQNGTQGTTGATAPVQTVTNNYNLTQNNTSPKPLTALETYQARRRQVNMIKAMTSV
jgi:phage-related minor tail protein